MRLMSAVSARLFSLAVSLAVMLARSLAAARLGAMTRAPFFGAAARFKAAWLGEDFFFWEKVEPVRLKPWAM